jgi:signal transduction histidine kinase
MSPEPLRDAASRRSSDAFARGRAALAELARRGERVTFQAVAREAGVSRQWLYTHTELRTELGDSPSIARGLLDEPTPEQAHSVLGVLARAACGRDGVEGLLEALVRERLRALWPVALDVSMQSGGPLGSLLARALDREADPDLAGEMLAAIPESTVALRELAAVAAGVVVEGCRSAAQQDPAARTALAQALDRHAIRLSDFARLEAALGAAEEAVDLQRELVSEDLDDKRRLAAALRSLANRRASLGGHQDALRANEEAVDLFRAVQDDGPGAKLELAGTLSSLSADLGEVGRVDEALDAVQEAIATLDPLFLATSSGLVGAALASAYTNFSNRLSDAGYNEGALEATRRALALYRGLGQQWPDAYEEKLAMTLANIAVDLRSMGAHDEALAHASEAVALLRRLDAQVPGPFRFLHDGALQLDATLSPEPVLGDPVLLERLAENLIENAVRYNAAVGWVRLSTGIERGEAVLHIANAGARIDPAAVEELLEPFRRLESSRARSTGGYGLGLAVVRAVAQAHGGRVAMLARREGGLEVTVALPLASSDAGEPIASAPARA